MDLNHVAVFVDNLDESALAPALGGWGGPVVSISRQPVTVNGRPGEHTGRTRRIRTAPQPPFGVSIEDVAPGAPIQPIAGDVWHHVAVWCGDVARTVEALEQHGYRKDVVGRDPKGKLATFAYMVSDYGPRLEVADAAMKARMLDYFASTAAADGNRPTAGDLSAPLTPREVAVVVGNVDTLERLKLVWQRGFGADWGEMIDQTVTVRTPDGIRELRTHRVSTRGMPCVTIMVPDAGSRDLLAPVDTNGWHHVGFTSCDLTGDIASLERSGFAMRFSDQIEEGGAATFALMSAPGGTLVKLTKGKS